MIHYSGGKRTRTRRELSRCENEWHPVGHSTKNCGWTGLQNHHRFLSAQ